MKASIQQNECTKSAQKWAGQAYERPTKAKKVNGQQPIDIITQLTLSFSL